MRSNGVLLNMFLYTFIYTVLAYIWQGVEWLMIGEIRESDVDTVICLAFAFSVYWNVQHIIEKKQKQKQAEEVEDDLAE